MCSSLEAIVLAVGSDPYRLEGCQAAAFQAVENAAAGGGGGIDAAPGRGLDADVFIVGAPSPSAAAPSHVLLRVRVGGEPKGQEGRMRADQGGTGVAVIEAGFA